MSEGSKASPATRVLSYVVGAIAVILVCAFLATIAITIGPRVLHAVLPESAEEKQAAAEAKRKQAEFDEQFRAASEPKRECVIAMRGNPGRVVVFPTEDGFAEAMQAAADRDERAYKAALLANGAFAVDSGTPCALLERKRGRAKVRLLGQDHAMQVVFLTMEQTSME